jgi:hypothetical protein
MKTPHRDQDALSHSDAADRFQRDVVVHRALADAQQPCGLVLR